MTRPIAGRSRPGFTLIETIVTVGLLAVLAAFVVPTVIQKANAGDPIKVASDVNAIGSALSTFSSDLKSGFPNQIHMLTDKPHTTNHIVDSTTAIDTAQVLAWAGPYVGTTIGGTPKDSVATGFGAFIKNYIARYDAVNNAAEHYIAGSGTGGVFNASNTMFAALTITGLTAAQAFAINKIVDGAGDVDLPATDPTNPGANVTGRFRYDKPDGTGHVTAYYLAAPITG